MNPNLQLFIFQNFESELLRDTSTYEDLSRQLRIVRVGHVVLPDVAVKPVGHVQVFVVHRNQDVGQDGWHVRQHPPDHFINCNTHQMVI